MLDADPLLLEIWLKASNREPMFMPSTIGRQDGHGGADAMPVRCVLGDGGLSKTRTGVFL